MPDNPPPTAVRDFTEPEKKAIIAAHRSRKVPLCPVDGSAMDVHLQRSLGLNSNVTIRCPRCSHSVQYTKFHG
jgi:hypothetical protein